MISSISKSSLPSSLCLSLLLCLAWIQPATWADPVSEETQTTSNQPLSLDADPNAREAAFDERLIGYWEYHSDNGVITLEILDEHDLRFAGRELKFELRPGALHIVDEENGDFEYAYKFQDNHLILNLTEVNGVSHQLSFERVDLGQDTSRQHSASPKSLLTD